MTREELIAQLLTLKDKAASSDVREVQAAASVLCGLVGALHERGAAERLMHHMAPFAEAQIRRLSAGRN